MGTLNTYYSEYVRQWLRHYDCSLGPYDIAKRFRIAYLQCQTGLIASNGFPVTGIYPCNRIVLDDEFIASERS